MYLRKSLKKTLEALEELNALREQVSAVLDGIRKRTLRRKSSWLIFKFGISGRIVNLEKSFKYKCMSNTKVSLR